MSTKKVFCSDFTNDRQCRIFQLGREEARMATRALHSKYLARQKIATNGIQIIYKPPHELEFYIWESHETEDQKNRYEVQVVVEGRMYVLRKLPTREDAERWYVSALRDLRIGLACLLIGETVTVVKLKELS